MPYIPYLYEWSPLGLVQVALTVWMLVDASRRRVDAYWYLIILAVQPFGAWAYFFLYKVKDFRGGNVPGLAGLFHRRPSLQEVRRRAERLPTVANRLELGERLVEAGSYAEAVPHLEAVLAHEPEHGQALFVLAECHRGLGQPAQAVPLLQKLVARQPAWGDYEAWRTLVAARQEAGDTAGAVAACRELARIAPELRHRCLLAERLLEAGEKDEARRVVEQGLDDYRYLTSVGRRRDRRWVGKAKQLLRQAG
jgi:hypothetical protein